VYKQSVNISWSEGLKQPRRVV